MADIPPIAERLSLRDAGRSFDPPLTKKAIERLVQRHVLRFKKDEKTGQLWTTREWLEEYVAATSRARRLRAPGGLPAADVTVGDVLEWAADPDAHNPWRRVAEELMLENRRLRERLAALERRGS
jgi:hypothetical protein